MQKKLIMRYTLFDSLNLLGVQS